MTNKYIMFLQIVIKKMEYIMAGRKIDQSSHVN